MSHRKFKAPRHGSLGFLPRKRSRTFRGRIRAFPKDDQSKPVHLTGFMGYKVGMTHIVREVDKLGSRSHKKEVVEPVTLVECPPVVVVGVVGYAESPTGLRAITTVWAKNIGLDFKKRLYAQWNRSKKKAAFTKYADRLKDKPETQQEGLERLKKYASIIRVIIHTEPSKLPALRLSKAHILEVQVNGGTVAKKVDWAKQQLEQRINVTSVFNEDERVDISGVNRGRGYEGVTTRWGTRRLPRKTHKGLRKVACIGSWHPARIRYSVARSGQMGYFHRVEANKKIYKIAKGSDENSGSTTSDITTKSINPMGGWPYWGEIKHDYLMIKGSTVGPKRRPLVFRKALYPQTSRAALEKINLKFIDTSSMTGTGRFQTSQEKLAFMGKQKKHYLREQEEKEKKEN